MKTMIAYQFTSNPVPTLYSLSDSKVYLLKEKVLNGEKLTRNEKDWITEQCNINTFSKTGIPLRGYMFDFSIILKRYWVKSVYGGIAEIYAIDKTSIRNYYSLRINKIVKIV